MKYLRLTFIISIITAPVIFFIYYNLNLVCEPRAYFFEIITGALSLSLFLTAYRFKKIILFSASAAVPVYVILIAPVVMVTRLGGDKWLGERLTAYYTFEFFALLQLIIISMIIGMLLKNKQN